MPDISVIHQILDAGRWAPSGDNTQPWRFEVVNEFQVIVHAFDTRRHCVYDLDGHSSQIAVGALLETLSIAATSHRLRMQCTRLDSTDEERPVFHLQFVPDAGLPADGLHACIARRSVQRRPLSTRPLTAAEKSLLEASVGPSFSVQWLEGFSAKRRTAQLMFRSARLRLTMPEAYEVHRSIIQWQARYSDDRVPDQALGIDPLTLRVMRFAMKSWDRVDFFNRFLAGTWAPRIQMDFVPALCCAAHFVLQPKTPATQIEDYVAAGRAVQRFWLTATHLGLALQPELTPLIFVRYAWRQLQFSATPGMQDAALGIAKQWSALVGNETAERAVFMGRLGHGPEPQSRSLRRTLQSLTVLSDR